MIALSDNNRSTEIPFLEYYEKYPIVNDSDYLWIADIAKHFNSSSSSFLIKNKKHYVKFIDFQNKINEIVMNSAELAASFQDQKTAEFHNEHFVCIKVDREEFPDLDNYYQSACHLFTNGGGWPLSAFVLPDMRPFFVGTYFPKVARNGETSFMDLLAELNRAYTQEHDKVLENASRVTETIEKGMVSNEKIDFSGHFPAPMSVLEALKQFKDEQRGHSKYSL